jgi:hypothetical protein
MAKYASTILAAALVATLAACSGEDEPDPTPGVQPVVYSAGVALPSATAAQGKPTIWKDAAVYKQVDANGYFASVCVSGGVVHAVGVVQDGATVRPYYWKSPDTTGAYLPAVGPGTAEAVCVQAGNVYVAGYDQEGGKVWRNGTQLYRLEGYPQSWPYSIAVSPAGTVFTAGEDLYGAAIWEDADILDYLDEDDGFEDPYFNAVAFANNTVYAAGAADGRPVWMKEGGVPNYLGQADGEAKALHLPGDGYLYVALTDESSAIPGSMVYKGLASGVTMTPDVGFAGTLLESVFVLGGDVYVGGAATADGQTFTGGVWRKGGTAPLHSMGPNTIVSSIYVVAAPQ